MNGASLLISATLLLVAGAAVAADRVEATGGQGLANHWCAECHAVGRGQLTSPNPDAPSFVAIAQLPSTTSLALHAFLHTPHDGMPDIRLTPAETDDLVDYILSLRAR